MCGCSLCWLVVSLGRVGTNVSEGPDDLPALGAAEVTRQSEARRTGSAAPLQHRTRAALVPNAAPRNSSNTPNLSFGEMTGKDEQPWPVQHAAEKRGASRLTADPQIVVGHAPRTARSPKRASQSQPAAEWTEPSLEAVATRDRWVTDLDLLTDPWADN